MTQVRFHYPPSAADQVQLLRTPTLISFFLFFPPLLNYAVTSVLLSLPESS